MRRPALTAVIVLLALCLQACASVQPRTRVLVFTKTAGWRHDSIPAAVAALQRLGAQEGMQVDHTEAATFDPGLLKRYQAIVFANTTLDVLDESQQAAMEGFIRAGGGFMGIHAAADTEYDWPWYGQLVGAWFKSHPPGLQTTRVVFEHDGVATGIAWTVTDEIYNYRSNPRANVAVTATVREADYTGGAMGEDHPVAWCHGFDGGRAWYTGLGHAAALYADPRFEMQLRRGLRYAAGLSAEC
ncbi:ThuA domain-containing protein [Pseudoxanthomonas gei]|uniref:ThuA domain-containing protein n=1 Tax=Pseudoxanthomonas gei TaxID=1383030 RepID=A0ABX0AFQ3_9GAMM|nr:ThuA domain-containing protein [Pseudoxanthomonas gei]